MSFSLTKCEFARGYQKPAACFGCAAPIPPRRRRWCSDRCCRIYYENHDWNIAREAALTRDRRRCVKCFATQRLQVNHKTPRYGRGYHRGCWNHQSNLETLCHRCHSDVTAQQRRERPEETKVIVWVRFVRPRTERAWESPYLAPRLRRKAEVYLTLAAAVTDSQLSEFKIDWLYAPFELAEADLDGGYSLVERKKPLLHWSTAEQWVKAAQFVGPALANALGDVRSVLNQPEASEAPAGDAEPPAPPPEPSPADPA